MNWIEDWGLHHDDDNDIISFSAAVAAVVALSKSLFIRSSIYKNLQEAIEDYCLK
jgi:hypothetical protein